MIFRAARWAFELIRQGQTRFLLAEAWMRLYKRWQEFIFALRYHVFGSLPDHCPSKVTLLTNHPIAFESPDHLIPWGTSRDNSTNKKFVRSMNERLSREIGLRPLGSLDLGCSGGQLVRDFYDLGWLAVGLEGSDYSLKHRRANWPDLAGKNLFTCDITKPFEIKADEKPARFHLITAWEVLEHIPTSDLPQLFKNIVDHLAPGGYFVGSTTSAPDVHNGVDLHQTKWKNHEWQKWVLDQFPQLEAVDLGLRYYQFVRHNEEGSFLTFRKTLK